MNDADALLTRISDEHRLLLVAALGDTEPARRAWAAWRSAVDFDEIDGTASRLLPILARRTDVIDPDDPVTGRVRGLYRRAWVANERSFAAADAACAALVAAGIHVLHVEALPLATMSGDTGVRPLWDVDVCVPRRSVRAALAELGRLGWTSNPRGARARWQRWPRHLVRVECRLRLIEQRPWPGADRSAWSRALPSSTSGVCLLAPHDLLVHAAVRAQQPWQPPGGYWVADLVHCATALGHRRVADVLGDSDVLECAGSHGAVDALHVAAAAAERIVG
ncbi:MAG: nucleotidyltransferase family protein [Acidimicrobiia bacterium]